MYHDSKSFDLGYRRDWAIYTEFRALIDELESIRADRDPAYYLFKLEQLRVEARRCRLSALVFVTEKCELALTRALQADNVRHFERDYALLMREAVECGEATPAQSEALLASVAYRMTG